MRQDSIYYFKGAGEFKNFIRTIDDKTLKVSEALSTFRETKCLPDEFKHKTVKELIDEPTLILDLNNALRKGMAPESMFKLPFKKVERQQELIENLAENYNIDTEKAKAKVVTRHQKNDKTGQEFNYWLEVIIAPYIDRGIEAAGKIAIIGNVNSTPSISGGQDYFTASEQVYFWNDKKGKQMVSSSLGEILRECGYNTSLYVKPSKRKVPSIMYINLNTPCPDWLGSAGKTHINLQPYAKDIADTVSSLAYKMPSYHGEGIIPHYDHHIDRQKSARSYLEDFLRERFDAIKKDPTIIHNDPLTQSGVWYRIRPIMINDGFDPRKNWGKTREYLTGEIDKLCTELFHNIEREDLGIVAKARGMMIYDGNIYPVDMDTFEELGQKGVFILVIEKEGIARILTDSAKDTGVALVHTAGRFTKYVRYLIEHAKVPVATLTDYDAYGVEIAKATISNTHRIGIDMDVVEWLQENGFPDLTVEDVEEEYRPGIYTNDEYLKQYRIELDSIAEKVGPKNFWDYIKYKIEKQQEKDGFDYSNIITQPEETELRPTEITDLVTKLDQYVGEVIKDDWEIIDEELSTTKKLILIDEHKKNNLETLTDTIKEDNLMKEQIIPRVNKLIDELKELLD